MNLFRRLLGKLKNDAGGPTENSTKSLDQKTNVQKEHLAARAVDIVKDRWWLLPHGQQKSGPFTLEELKRAYCNETNTNKLAIRKDGDPDWVKWVNAKIIFPCLADYFEEIDRNNSNGDSTLLIKEGVEVKETEEFFYMKVPDYNFGECSDDSCPCGLQGEKIQRNKGYLYISEEVVKMRRDCRSWQEFVEKATKIGEEMQRRSKANLSINLGKLGSPTLICEQGAKKRNLDLSVAAEDAKQWWHSGKVPLRPTPKKDNPKGINNTSNSNKNSTNKTTNLRKISAPATTALPQDPGHRGEPNLDEMVSATATALKYKSKGALRIVHDESGKATGIWLRQIPEKDRLPSFLKMVATFEKLDQTFYISISLGDYRIVEGDVGSFVMIGGALAPDEVIQSLDSARWEKGRPNPVSPKVDRLSEGVQGIRFLCPTCGIPNYCFDNQIVAYTGAMVQCAHCKNISHVPANAQGAETSAGFDVYACSFVPIVEFSDWLMAHPSCEGGDPADWSSYGLWAYCADCAHRYASSVLFPFSMSTMLGGMVFNANSTESATDIDSLRSGECPSCTGSNLLALLIDVPENVKAKLNEFRGC